MNNILDNELFDAISSASEQVYVYVCDMETNLSRWSQNAVEYFDMPDEYVDDAATVWMKKIHPDDVKAYAEDIGAIFDGTSNRHICEYRAMNRFGDYVWLECRGTVLQDENGKPKLFAGIMCRLDVENKYDPLTSLKTIHAFYNNDFSQGTGSILLLGIDGFREVINHYSYSFADRALHDFSVCIKEFCGPERSVYRMEGDEFVIVSPGATKTETTRLFNELRKATANLTLTDGQCIGLSFSGGAALYPKDGQQREVLLSSLEHSLQHAKRYKRGGLVYFSEEIAREHHRTIRLKHALAMSIQNNFEGFSLCFQPIVTATDHQLSCCEALMRWESDETGPVPISEVIKLLEYSGEICAVGRWLVQQVFSLAKTWQVRYPNLMIGLNLSYLQFKEEGFVNDLIATAKEYDINPKWICLELTESSRVDDLTGLAYDFEKLRDFGFCVSLDDFGIAYSTLLLLRHLPVDSVKIDHSFILNLDEDSRIDLAIVESVVMLCQRLGIRVVVEGIENAKTLDIVKRFPVTFLQGYYFSRPVKQEAFEKLLKNGYIDVDHATPRAGTYA